MMEITHGPRTKPRNNETFIAQFSGKCYECKGTWEPGDDVAWLYNPYKEPGDKDFKVHKEHWYDAEWEFNHPDQEAPPKVVQELHGFKWAVSRMREGEDVRVKRQRWPKSKYLKMVLNEYGVEQVYVITEQSKHEYTYPRYDGEAEDWKLVGR